MAHFPPAISGQRGHDTTFRAACILVHGFALDHASALTLLMEWNANCSPPWSDCDLERKIGEAGKAQGTKPRGYLLAKCPVTSAVVRKIEKQPLP
jgi:hypothetical protein